jgi:hypothetical protein
VSILDMRQPDLRVDQIHELNETTFPDTLGCLAELTRSARDLVHGERSSLLAQTGPSTNATHVIGTVRT